jgi:hypothetical protein
VVERDRMLDLAGRASVRLRAARRRDGYSVVSCSSFAPMSARSVTLETFPTWVRGSGGFIGLPRPTWEGGPIAGKSTAAAPASNPPLRKRAADRSLSGSVGLMLDVTVDALLTLKRPIGLEGDVLTSTIGCHASTDCCNPMNFSRDHKRSATFS